eukprot:2488077-Pyramimonas_sp.AAC.1
MNLHHSAPHNKDEVYQRRNRVYEEEDEALVVVVPDAVVDPYTVVVHAQDAPIAHAAVVSAR